MAVSFRLFLQVKHVYQPIASVMLCPCPLVSRFTEVVPANGNLSHLCPSRTATQDSHTDEQFRSLLTPESLHFPHGHQHGEQHRASSKGYYDPRPCWKNESGGISGQSPKSFQYRVLLTCRVHTNAWATHSVGHLPLWSCSYSSPPLTFRTTDYNCDNFIYVASFFKQRLFRTLRRSKA